MSYNDSTGQQQEYQLVHGRVSSWSLILWYEAKYFLFIVLLHNLSLGTSVVGDDPFESPLELFRVVLQDYREAYRRCSNVKRDHSYLLCGQMLDFLHRSLRRIVSRESWPEENSWYALLGFDFIEAQLLSISQFMEKTEFRTKARRAAKGRINVELERHKKAMTDTFASAVMGDMFNPVNQERAYIRYVCTEILKHPRPTLV